MSVMLKNVNINDTGIYDCEVSVSTGRRKRAQFQLFCTIELKVEDSGELGQFRLSLDLNCSLFPVVKKVLVYIKTTIPPCVRLFEEAIDRDHPNADTQGGAMT